jgi:hypothetical protein
MHGTYVQKGRRRVVQSSTQHGNEFPCVELYHAVCSRCGLIDAAHTKVQAAKAALDHKKKFN